MTTGTVIWKKQNKITTLCFIHLKYLQRYSQTPGYCPLPKKQFRSKGQWTGVPNLLPHKSRILTLWKSHNVSAKQSIIELGLGCAIYPLARAKQFNLHNINAKWELFNGWKRNAFPSRVIQILQHLLLAISQANQKMVHVDFTSGFAYL